MSQQQYIRKVKLTVGDGSGGISVEQLKIVFEVQKNMSGKPNQAKIEIWNLKKENRAKLAKEWDKVVLEAGYENGGVGVIFTGTIREALHVRVRPDVKTVIECADGDKAYREGTISKVMPEGTKPKDVVQELLKNMPDVSQGELKGLDQLPAFARSIVMHGPVAREMDKLSRSHGFYWSIQNGSLETLPAREAFSQTILIDPDSGMIGPPTVTDSGVKVKALLNPQFAPGRQIKIKSNYFDAAKFEGKTSDQAPTGEGTFRISSVVFAGDNIDGDFSASIEGEKINGKSVGGASASETR